MDDWVLIQLPEQGRRGDGRGDGRGDSKAERTTIEGCTAPIAPPKDPERKSALPNDVSNPKSIQTVGGRRPSDAGHSDAARCDSARCNPAGPKSSANEPLNAEFSEALKGVDGIQRAGQELYETYCGEFQGKWLELCDRSRWAFERAKAETQRVLSALSDIDGSSNTELNGSSAVEQSPKKQSPTPARLASHKAVDTATLEREACRTIIPLLAQAGAPLFDGNHFQAWFQRFEDLFDEALPKEARSAAAFVCSVKLYSTPDIAVAIEDSRASMCPKWTVAADYLEEYFEKKRLRAMKFEALLAAHSSP